MLLISRIDAYDPPKINKIATWWDDPSCKLTCCWIWSVLQQANLAWQHMLACLTLTTSKQKLSHSNMQNLWGNLLNAQKKNYYPCWSNLCFLLSVSSAASDLTAYAGLLDMNRPKTEKTFVKLCKNKRSFCQLVFKLCCLLFVLGYAQLAWQHMLVCLTFISPKQTRHYFNFPNERIVLQCV